MTDTSVQKGFRLDTNLCTGCGACAVACAIENELPWGTSWRWIETFNPDHISGLPSYHLSLACNHCADAPCMEHCPALAYERDNLVGAVLLDPDKCIGCRYCTWACPYDAPKLDAHKGVVSKCTFCHHRQVEGLAPACVQQCPTGALTFGDVGTLQGSASVAGFPETAARPSVRFVEARNGVVVGAKADPSAMSNEMAPAAPSTDLRKTSLRTEGPLVLFTLLVALLVGSMASDAGRAMLARPLLGVPAFLLLAAVATGASTLHLGRKGRAWRAVLNLRRSWLSREIALFVSFVVVSMVALLPSMHASSGALAPLARALGPTVSTLSWLPAAAAVVGLGLLFAVDRVYAVTRTPGLEVHSARVVLTGLMVAGLAMGSALVWCGILGLKMVSYAARKLRYGRARRPVRGSWTVVRVGSALAASGLLLTAAGYGSGRSHGWVVAGLVLLAVGEVVDRCELYLDLEVRTPRAEMRRVLSEAGRGS